MGADQRRPSESTPFKRGTVTKDEKTRLNPEVRLDPLLYFLPPIVAAVKAYAKQLP